MQNIKSNSHSIIKFLKITKNNRVITTLNPSYSYGLSIINTHLLVGASIVLTNLTFFDKLFWKLLRDAKANTFGGVPFHYQVLQKIKFEQFNLPSLKYLTHAGGLIFQETKNYIEDVFKVRLEIYESKGEKALNFAFAASIAAPAASISASTSS